MESGAIYLVADNANASQVWCPGLADIAVSGKVDIRGLTKFVKGIKAGSQISGSGPMNDMLKAWGSRYLVFAERRFSKFSRGGGDWKPLAESTKKARRGGGKRRKTRSSRASTKTTSRGTGKKFGILWNTGQLVNALKKGGKGNLFKRVKGGIQVGFGGSAKHENKLGKRSYATIAEIATHHNVGGGNLPRREILVKPDEATIRAMKAAAIKYVGKIGKSSSI